jgi:hypothetical protein
MEPVVGAAVAAVVAWLSILGASLLPARRFDPRALRVGGGLSLAAVGLAMMGAPIPAWLPIAAALGAVAFGLRPRPAAQPP